ncbi:MAG: hypothetical protein ACREL9_09480 [Gemmatimonadales bacterium]
MNAAAPGKAQPHHDRREAPKRRELVDRRSGVDRRALETAAAAPVDRRGGLERRVSDRRTSVERRLALHSAGDQIRTALRFLSQLAETATLDDEVRRGLDAAMLRMRFALERLEEGGRNP